MSRTNLATFMAAALALAVVSGAAQASDLVNVDDPAVKDYVVGDKYTGYVTATPETRQMQDDDFANPGMINVDLAQEAWNKVDGEAGKSCASCHGDVSSMKGVGTRYPLVHPRKNDLVTVMHQINICREEHQQAKPWKWESGIAVGMDALIRMQSRGMPIKVAIDGAAKPYYEKGRDFYFERRGQMDLACNHCHVESAGNMVRSELLSQGMPNGFPTYRLKWQKLGSLHRRFKGCNDNIRAEPFGRGSPEYTALELYVMWRAEGLPVEAPSVRK